jgi:hypothetical protein
MSLVKSDGSTKLICSANMDARLGNNKGPGFLEKPKIPCGATKPADGFRKRRVKFFPPVTAEMSKMPTAPASPVTALGKAVSDREKPSRIQARGVRPSSLQQRVGAMPRSTAIRRGHQIAQGPAGRFSNKRGVPRTRVFAERVDRLRLFAATGSRGHALQPQLGFAFVVLGVAGL